MFIPTNEQGVIFLWGSICHIDRWIPVHLQTAYPDAIFEKDGKRYRIEFEYKSSNFIAHGHDPDGCDLIVCWEDTIKYKFSLPIIELCNYVTPSLVKEAAEIASVRYEKIEKPVRSYHRKRGYHNNRTLDRILYESVNNGGMVIDNISLLAKRYEVSRGTIYNALFIGIDEEIITKDSYGRYEVTGNKGLIPTIIRDLSES